MTMKIDMKVLGALVALACVASGASAAQVEFDREALRTTPERLGIGMGGVASYELAAYDFDPQAAQKRARELFGKSPAAAKARGARVETVDGKDRLKISAGPVEYEMAMRSGGEYLLDLSRYAIAEPAAKVPASKDLRATSDAYVKAFLPGIDAREIRFVGFKRIMDSATELGADGVPKPGAATTSTVASYVALYERRLAGVPVFGPGERVRVYLGSDGKVTGHSMVWRKVAARLDTRPVVSTREIQKVLVERHAKNTADRITVDRIYFGYLAQGRYSEQATLSPVYHVGFVYGPESKRVFETFDAYTGRLIEFARRDEPSDDRRAQR